MSTTDVLSQTPNPVHRRDVARLRLVLRVNAAFSACTGLVAVVAAGRLAELFDLDQVWLVTTTGVGLLTFAGAVTSVARSPLPVLHPGAAAVSAADLGWVAGTVVVIGAGLVSTTGMAVLAATGVVVLDFGLAQLVLRRRVDAAA